MTMRKTIFDTPLRLAWLALVSALLFGLIYPIGEIRPHSAHPDTPVWLVWLVIQFIVGLAVSVVAYLRLKNGMAGDLWSDVEIERARRVFLSRAMLAMPVVSLFAYVAWGIVCMATNRHVSGLVITIYPITAAGRLIALFRPQVATPLRTSEPPVPFFSEHWGEKT